jgi:hypothetical protein
MCSRKKKPDISSIDEYLYLFNLPFYGTEKTNSSTSFGASTGALFMTRTEEKKTKRHNFHIIFF